MSARLTDFKGTLKSSPGTRRPKVSGLPVLTASSPVSAPAAAVRPEIQVLQQIPGIAPFLTADLIPDMVYLLQYEGVNSTVDQLFPVTILQGEAPPAPPNPVDLENRKRRGAVKEAFSMRGLDSALQAMGPPEQRDMFIQMIYTLGAQRLAELVAAADPLRPASIIFRHSSQDVHRATQKVEIELIKNEPEVEESDTIQCTCGSKKVRTVTKQTRRADEPPTIFATCVVCKKHWQFGAA